MARGAKEAGFNDNEIARASRLITPHHAGRPKSDPDTIRVVHGAYDLFCPAEAIDELVQAWKLPHVQTLNVGHRTFAFRFLRTAKSFAHYASALNSKG